ncbi:hypothetical protein CWE09_12500 [Aliidiomarina minuta]|uniref:diguanylate cyclase n=1 Tax=Aliidiomarina minuta TaxID=880057 RepID=A0A432W3N2_9GAMM|nr:GGDEF domain-containing protein [Aliidiomarina minuta]RUO23963.1 hypothetical protein CWE09_12500 [Aliidiomarina minuta]
MLRRALNGNGYWITILATKRAERRRTALTRRLTTRLLVSISLWSTLLVFIITGISFWQTYTEAKSEQLSNMVNTTSQRIEREAKIFRIAEQNADILANAFLQRYQRKQGDTSLVQQYEDWFEETDPGVMRLRAAFYEGLATEQQYWQYLSAFAGPRNEAIDTELQSRIVIALETLAQYGPAWQHLVANTHISMPENVLLIYSQDSAWGLLASPTLDITAYAVVRSTLQSHNPEREPNWTGLYFDESAREWVITYQRPTDLQGRHLISASHDIYLTDVMERLVRSDRDGVSHMIFNQNRELIATPEDLSSSMQKKGIMSLDQLQNPIYEEVYQLLENNPPAHNTPVQILEKEASDNFVIATMIAGPEWWHVTIFPRQLIQQASMQTPLRVAVLSLTLLIMVLLVVYVFVNYRVSMPLRQLSNAANLVGQQRYQEVADGEHELTGKKSEIGLLARSFQDMAKRILEHQSTLERAVQARTAALASANQKLDAIAHMDGLTGILNRRAFDRDLELQLSRPAPVNCALLLADVDHFKAFNDNYGHQAGDHVLQDIASTLNKPDNVRVYRYGGEEIAILVDAETAEQAEKIAHQLCQRIEALNIEHQHSEHGLVTLSMGVTMLRPQDTAEATIERADKALYQAKSAGRNLIRSG